jgi:hypothetical protein
MHRETTTTITKATTSSHGQRRYVRPSMFERELINRSSNSRTTKTDITISTILAKT